MTWRTWSTSTLTLPSMMQSKCSFTIKFIGEPVTQNHQQHITVRIDVEKQRCDFVKWLYWVWSINSKLIILYRYEFSIFFNFRVKKRRQWPIWNYNFQLVIQELAFLLLIGFHKVFQQVVISSYYLP